MAVWLIVFGWYAAWSLVVFCAMGIDKRRAEKGAWRIKEKTLHTMSLFGGWPGCFVGMHVFKHKRRKGRFVLVVWGNVLVHAVGWCVAAWLLGWV